MQQRNPSCYIRTLPQEIKYYLTIALPMIFSFTTEPVMHFFDRLFLSHFKEGQAELYLSASFAGGLCAFMFMSFFTSTLGYASTVVAQYYGANKPKECGNIASQTILMSLYSFPCMLIFFFFIDDIFMFFNHSPEQIVLATTYSRILLVGSIFTLLKSGIAGFFIGLGKTTIVMVASIIAMILNIPLNYVLIYGWGSVPSLGIVGAALATIISACVSLLFLLVVFWSNKYHRKFITRMKLSIHKLYMKKILHYGLPAGMETIISVGVFSFFILAMSSYGHSIGAAVTIAINWDSMFLFPMLGASFATTAIVGQYMGSRNIPSVIRIVKISLLFMLCFCIFMVYMFNFQYDFLINLFLENASRGLETYEFAVPMLRLASIYLIGDGISLLMSAVLHGSGDTKAQLFILVVVNVIFAILFSVFIFSQRVSPLGAWGIFIGFPLAIGVGVGIRFYQGKWKEIKMVE